jgi:hypothetical protein
MTEEIKWNSALQDLELLSNLEHSAIEANINNNVEMYYKLLKAYFQKLCSIVEFERDELITRFNNIKVSIYSIDTNKDGKIDEWEQMNAAVVLGQAKESLELIYYELTKIKVNSGLSVQKVYYKDALKGLQEKRAKKASPVLEFK